MRLKKLLLDKTFVTLAISVVLIITMGMFRPDKPRGVPPIRYWAEKLTWTHCADMVLTGDSRVFVGISPAEMQQVLANRRILNFGFGGNGYGRSYLDAIEGVLDPASPTRTIVLGISAHSLTLPAVQENSYLELKKKTRHDLDFEKRAGGFLEFFEPMSFRDAAYGMFPSLKKSHHFIEYHPDGWVARRREPEKVKSELRRYRGYFMHGAVSDDVVALLMDYVRRWTQKGIRVYAFRPPASEPMYELEQELSGFCRDEFIRQLEAAGGQWIEVDPCGYHSYDGSHLHQDSALVLSNDLARQIAQSEKQIQTSKGPSR